jgi:hypothetical protein
MHQDIHMDIETREVGGQPLLEIAEGLANGVHTLLPGCTAAVIVALGDEWQLLASRGQSDTFGSFDAALAGLVRGSDEPAERPGHLVAPFASVTVHALLVLIGDDGQELPERAPAIVLPLLDAGGILLDRAIAVQERDRAVRRVVLLCQEHTGRPPHSRAYIEHALTLLWPDTRVRFYDRATLAGASWSERRIVRTACDLDRPTISRRPVSAGLLERDHRYQIAIPMLEQLGALVIDMPAAGEELDTRSVAAAVALTRDASTNVHPLMTAVPNV